MLLREDVIVEGKTITSQLFPEQGCIIVGLAQFEMENMASSVVACFKRN